MEYNLDMSINGDCIHCGGHSTDAEWDAWNGECQWCGEFDVEWEEHEAAEDGDGMDEWDEDMSIRDDYGWGEDDE